jgi:hypothetical protein
VNNEEGLLYLNVCTLNEKFAFENRALFRVCGKYVNTFVDRFTQERSDPFG